MSLLKIADAEIVKVPSSQNDYFHAVAVWPNGVTVCTSLECRAAKYGGQCHAVKDVLAQMKAKAPTPDEIAANEQVEPHAHAIDDDELRMTVRDGQIFFSDEEPVEAPEAPLLHPEIVVRDFDYYREHLAL